MLAFQEFREEKRTKSTLQNSGIAHVSNCAPFGLCFAARCKQQHKSCYRVPEAQAEGQLHWTITTLSSTYDFP
jgi:hypothetical protein